MDMRPLDTKFKSRMDFCIVDNYKYVSYKEYTLIIENDNIEDINFEEKVDVVGIGYFISDRWHTYYSFCKRLRSILM